ncbi:glycosyltransferase [Nonomuraea dietziae]|uniref:glycosyltransferase n=1 Tax=Nonomuraea dietziae TaxID=65515 RepID=UPI00342810DC
MPSPAARPRLAVIVGNAITGDSRVQKTALAAARDGWEVTLVGRAAGGETEYSSFGPVRVIRVAVDDVMRKHAWVKRQRRGLRARITQWGLPDERALARYRTAHRVWVREQRAHIGWTYGAGASGALSRHTRRLWIRLGRHVHQARVRAFRWERRRSRRKHTPVGEWRRDMPELIDLELAFGAVLDDLRPHVIHANDITMIGVAAQSAARLRSRGFTCRWLYDAHEYVRGADWHTELRTSAYHDLERQFIGRADAVVTVSPEIAEVLRQQYHLPSTPLVVRNTPIREAVGRGESSASVRAACGLGPDTPLLVYSGWMDRDRSVDTAVASLTSLPHVHLAIVSGRKNAVLRELLELAERIGVSDRVHVVPYVPQADVADYLSTADLGLICSKRLPNHEMSLPTKLAEYLHAGLALVVSDVRTVATYVNAHGVGEVFSSGDVPAFAAAVRRGLSRRKELAENISEAILKELSWEYQCSILLQLYRDLSGLTPPPPSSVVPWDARERMGSVTDGGWTPLRATPIRLGLGPANHSGQLAAFAQAISRERGDVSMEVVMLKRPGSPSDYPADHYLDPAAFGRRDTQIAQIQRTLGRYTHLLADAFLPILGRLNGEHVDGDLPALLRAGIKVALLAHGSEVRHPLRHMERHEHSLFHDAPEEVVRRLTAVTEHNHRIARECGLPVFVTTPDLLDDLPQATWAPLVVDVNAWACDAPVMRRSRPKVLHAPSKRWTKGTARILPALTGLHERGVIDFQLAENVSWSQMRALVREADIVVDQFAIGSYGTFACEGMAAGKPVMAYLSESAYGSGVPVPPIVNATVDTIGPAMERLLDDRDATARIGVESAAFARAYHDGTQTVRALAGFLR